MTGTSLEMAEIDRYRRPSRQVDSTLVTSKQPVVTLVSHVQLSYRLVFVNKPEMTTTTSRPRRSARARSSVTRYTPATAPKATLVRPRKTVKAGAPKTKGAKAPAVKAKAPAAKATKAKAARTVDGVMTFRLSPSCETFDISWSEGKYGQGLSLRGGESLDEVMRMFCKLAKTKPIGKIKFEDIDGEPYDADMELGDAMGDEEGWVRAVFK